MINYFFHFSVLLIILIFSSNSGRVNCSGSEIECENWLNVDVDEQEDNNFIFHIAAKNNDQEAFKTCLSKPLLHIVDDTSHSAMHYVSSEAVYDAIVGRFFIEFKRPILELFEKWTQFVFGMSCPLSIERLMTHPHVLLEFTRLAMKMNRHDDFKRFTNYLIELDYLFEMHQSDIILWECIEAVFVSGLRHLLEFKRPRIDLKFENAIFERATRPGGAKLFHLYDLINSSLFSCPGGQSCFCSDERNSIRKFGCTFYSLARNKKEDFQNRLKMVYDDVKKDGQSDDDNDKGYNISVRENSVLKDSFEKLFKRPKRSESLLVLNIRNKWFTNSQYPWLDVLFVDNNNYSRKYEFTKWLSVLIKLFFKENPGGNADDFTAPLFEPLTAGSNIYEPNTDYSPEVFEFAGIIVALAFNVRIGIKVEFIESVYHSLWKIDPTNRHNNHIKAFVEGFKMRRNPKIRKYLLIEEFKTVLRDGKDDSMTK